MALCCDYLSSTILKLFQELSYWQCLSYECPYYLSAIYQKKARLRFVREMVLLVVHDYNRLPYRKTDLHVEIIVFLYISV